MEDLHFNIQNIIIIIIIIQVEKETCISNITISSLWNNHTTEIKANETS